MTQIAQRCNPNLAATPDLVQASKLGVGAESRASTIVAGEIYICCSEPNECPSSRETQDALATLPPW